jgi:hypothetical protein
MNKTFKRLLKEYVKISYRNEYYRVKYEDAVREYNSYLNGNSFRAQILKTDIHTLRKESAENCKRFKAKYKITSVELSVVSDKINNHLALEKNVSFAKGKLS